MPADPEPVRCPCPARPRPALLSAGVWSVCGRSPGPGSDPLAFPSSGAPGRSPKGKGGLEPLPSIRCRSVMASYPCSS